MYYTYYFAAWCPSVSVNRILEAQGVQVKRLLVNRDFWNSKSVRLSSVGCPDFCNSNPVRLISFGCLGFLNSILPLKLND